VQNACRKNQKIEILLSISDCEYPGYEKPNNTQQIGSNRSMIIFIDDPRQLIARGSIKNSNVTINKMSEQIVNAFVAMVNERDPYTAQHCYNVARLACAIADEMGMDIDTKRGLYISGMLHDIGKTSIPLEILSKSGALTKTEWEILKSHPIAGYKIISKIEFPWCVSEMILQHHERLDGSGYPYGLKGDEIKAGSRILAVADVIDAMLSHRPYRPALTVNDVEKEFLINEQKYDKKVVKAALKLLPAYAKGTLKSINIEELFL